MLPLTAASSSYTRNTARRSVPILADSKTVTELQRSNHELLYQQMCLKRNKKCYMYVISIISSILYVKDLSTQKLD